MVIITHNKDLTTTTIMLTRTRIITIIIVISYNTKITLTPYKLGLRRATNDIDVDDHAEAAVLRISKDASVIRFLRLNSASVLSAIVRQTTYTIIKHKLQELIK